MNAQNRFERRLLAADAVVNLVLAGLLCFAPANVFQMLQLPLDGTGLYRYVLGGVLLGVGFALLQSFRGKPGLTLDGAIVINFCGAGALGIWLLLTPSPPMGVGSLILWALTVIILGLALVELFSGSRKQDG